MGEAPAFSAQPHRRREWRILTPRCNGRKKGTRVSAVHPADIEVSREAPARKEAYLAVMRGASDVRHTLNRRKALQLGGAAAGLTLLPGARRAAAQETTVTFWNPEVLMVTDPSDKAKNPKTSTFTRR